MPFNVSDVDTHKKGLGAKGKRAWVKVASAALSRCLDGGSEEATCDASAIRQANAVAGNVTESALEDIGLLAEEVMVAEAVGRMILEWLNSNPHGASQRAMNPHGG